MNIADLATPDRTPACWSQQMAFADRALEYDPRDDLFAHLDLLGHTILAAAKAAAEEAAVDVCFGCPLMLACEKIDIENQDRGNFVAGVIGGRTEVERRARRSRTGTVKVASVPNPQIAPGDRGPRNQVDDDLIASLTRAGQSSNQIAMTLNCSPRTVSRARKRVGLHAPRPSSATTAPAPAVRNQGEKPKTTPQSSPKSGPCTNRPTLSVAQDAAPLTNPFLGGRTIAPAMEAVYNHLAATGGTAHIDTLIEIGSHYVDTVEAMDWWSRRNTVVENGQRVLRGSKADTSLEERIRDGARGKVFNSIDATRRKGRYLTREGDLYTFKPAAMSAWNSRIQAAAAHAA